MKKWMPKRIAHWAQFIEADLWRALPSVSPAKSFLLRQLRVVILALRGFREDSCQLRASALTFYVLLSIVPVLAMAFGVAKGFGFEVFLRKRLMETFREQEQVITRLIEYACNMLENTKGGLVAGVGFVVLLWTIIKVLGSVEDSLNAIWGIARPRNLRRKFSDYLSIMLIAPALLVMSGSVTLAITAQARALADRMGLLDSIGPLLFFLLKPLPYLFVWLLFTFVYMFIPNTKVSLKSAVVGGVAGGTLFQIVQWGYIHFQVGVSSFGAIYGSFAALPLFLTWIQLSWLIVLFGAEISSAHQNVDTYEYEPDCRRVSHALKRLLALRIVQLCVRRFERGERPVAATGIARELGSPIRLTREIIDELADARLLSETKDDESEEMAYQPARAVEGLTLKTVVDLYEQRGSQEIPVNATPEYERIIESLAALDERVQQSPENVRLVEI